MDIHLHRTYFKEGTNGALFIHDSFFGFCIELPWLENRRNVSCIPEGAYILKARYSQKFGHHLILENVKNRTLILIHPANDALKELRGCIAPVTCLSGIGKGTSSRSLLNKLVSKCYQAFDRGETVNLIIKS
ncbi:hypothetical protein FHR24_001590 [Wenyingzhuangia heitensis]|uniref:DUF5675 domain-containing protein n=1 Tax=Wenyingzhuangia heitensis TaxID=1487859 RepID=A0ABX0UDB2_9FLAO|nr:DUF5675 family protein [Wenyingzhuangia heitensis]NIJ45151.1 hypothetical protein [Wenyingzhuangia heitensis]